MCVVNLSGRYRRGGRVAGGRAGERRDRVRASLGARAGLVDEFPEPQLQHHELPETMLVVRLAALVLAPDAADLGVVEDAAIAQPPAAQQLAGHGRERSAQPLADRRGE